MLMAAVIIVLPFVLMNDAPRATTQSTAALSSGENAGDQGTSIGQDLQRLVMPGELSEAHAKIENVCADCHSPFGKTTQKALCLNCHKDVQNDIELSRGFHGHSQQVKEQDCKNCHAEHKGRDAHLVLFDKTTFPHDQTNFKLQGAHANPSVTCDECHLAGKKFRDISPDCFSCHQKDDHHNGQLGKDCASCHSEKSWKEAHYDHSKTKFPLTGKHKEVQCALCHVNAKYKGTQAACINCHSINDVHADTKRTSCDKCHTTENWHQKVPFDHEKETGFSLKDGHGKAKCEDCHNNLIFKAAKGSKCVDCHQTDDVHHGHNGNMCNNCHTVSSWKKTTFDHDKNTKFKLLGKHKEAQCDDCHKRDVANQKLSMVCASCHQADDVHKGGLGKNCQECHNEKGWRTDVVFDHDMTKFPLIGLHATAACGACHLTRDYKEAKSNCIDCHQKNDFHKQTLGNDCGKCHNPNGWRLWNFDHSKTKFPLGGSHAGLACSKCHTQAAVGAKLPEITGGCYACHAKQNVHGKNFGTVYMQCDLCHDGVDFKIINKSRIQKIHHPPLDEKVHLSENCGTCHQKDDVHQGGFGNQCGECHSVDSFHDLSKIGR